MKILDLGCGRKKYAGAVGIDVNPGTDADIVWDLNVFPYPLDDNEFDLVICDNIIEHLDDPVKVMEELYRIVKPEGLIRIIVPYFSSPESFADITHKRFFSLTSFDVFNPDDGRSFYSSARFRVVRRMINFGRLRTYLGIQFLANAFPHVYERHFAYIFPAFSLHFQLKLIK